LICELELSNFKAFPWTERIALRPITLIYGPNSSGKTSVLKSLLLLKQTLEQSETAETVLQPKGLVDLGGYREFVYKHDVGRQLSFRLMMNDKFRVFLPFGGRVDFPEASPSGLKLSFGYDEERDAARLTAIELFLGQDKEPVITYTLDPNPQISRTFRTYRAERTLPSSAKRLVLRFESANFNHKFWVNLWSSSKASLSTNELLKEYKAELGARKKQLDQLEKERKAEPESSSSTKRKKSNLQKRINRLEKMLSQVENFTFERALKDFEEAHRKAVLICRNFLPTEVRLLPSESEPSEFEEEFDDIFDATAAQTPVAALIMAEVATLLRKAVESIAYLGPLRESPERHYIYGGNLADDVGKTGKLVPDVLFKSRDILKRVNEQLSKFGFGYKLEVASVGAKSPELHDVFALRLVDSVLDVNASIVDVGFGISQILPVLVQTMLSRSKLLCVEQPEIHLHPKLQGQLAELFVEATREPHNNHFIVETHSEHIMLRIQKLIRSGHLKASDVSVIYVDCGMSGSRCINLELNRNGEFLTNWPDGFFEESYREMFY